VITLSRPPSLDSHRVRTKIHADFYPNMEKFAYADPIYVESANVAVYGVESAPPAPTAQINEAGARAFMKSHKWPTGLQDTFLSNLARMPMRFFICDDSGSMVASDGHRLLGSDSNAK
jgi:hypothetical protein